MPTFPQDGARLFAKSANERELPIFPPIQSRDESERQGGGGGSRAVGGGEGVHACERQTKGGGEGVEPLLCM